jgi:hypothetical protein
MKKLFITLFLSLFFITSSQADDIRDFQIEGISVGDSLLDYIPEEKILSRKKFFGQDKKYENKEYSSYSFVTNDFDIANIYKPKHFV